MIDLAKLAEVRTALRAGDSPKGSLQDLSKGDLRKLYKEIGGLLSKEGLGALNLEDELVSQYEKTRDLLDTTLLDDGTPANQKSQVCNSVVAILAQLVKLQADFYTSERFRSIENIMIKYMKSLSKDEAEKFLNEYERIGGRHGR